MVQNLYVIDTVVEKHFCNLFDPRKMTIQQWHVFLGHPSITSLKHIPSLTGKFTELITKELEQCDICLKAKQCRESFPILNRRTDQLFDLILTDLWGPYSPGNVCKGKC